MSKRAALAFGLGASLLLAAGTANAAGNCTAEIDALQQQLGMDQGANATTGPSDPGVQQPSPSAPADTSASGTAPTSSDQIAGSGANTTMDNDANATIGANGSGVQQPAPEANATTGTSTGTSTTTGTDTDDGSSVATNNENTGANATIGATDPGVQQPSPQTADSSSTSGSSDTMSNGTSTMPSGTVTETSRTGTFDVTPSARSSALASLEKAKLYAKSGEEEACMSEVNSAKQMLGAQ
jgi:hypothetical protein